MQVSVVVADLTVAISGSLKLSNNWFDHDLVVVSCLPFGSPETSLSVKIVLLVEYFHITTFVKVIFIQDFFGPGEVLGKNPRIPPPSPPA